MSSANTLSYELSSQDVGEQPFLYTKKQMLVIQDTNTSYTSAQSKINTSSVSQSQYINYKESYLSVPVVMTMTGHFNPATAATSANYSLGLKEYFHSLIHSMSVDFNGTNVKPHCPFENVYQSFRLSTTLSFNELKSKQHIGFSPDNIESFSYF